jgi:hypothetical protein
MAINLLETLTQRRVRALKSQLKVVQINGNWWSHGWGEIHIMPFVSVC